MKKASTKKATTKKKAKSTKVSKTTKAVKDVDGASTAVQPGVPTNLAQ